MTASYNGDETPFDADPGTPSTEPKYSPVSVSAIHAAVGQRGFPPEYVIHTARALDEFQLALSSANRGNFITDQLAPLAGRARQLGVQRYTKPTDNSDILFFSGRFAETILRHGLGFADPPFVDLVDRYTLREDGHSRSPSVAHIEIEVGDSESEFEDRLIANIDSLEVLRAIQDIALDAFAIYRSEPGFTDTIGEDVRQAIAVRTTPHDELVMDEPGSYSTPIPGTRRRA